VDPSGDFLRDDAPTLFVMVGLPASGKTVRAKELEQSHRALRLTPDEWMIPLFGDHDADGRRAALEGRLVWVAMRALRLGLNVVLDFGVWSKDERSALRDLAARAGATCQLVFLDIDPVDQRRRRDERFAVEPDSTFTISDDDLTTYRESFEVPDELELTGPPLDPPPTGYETWTDWAASRWPTSFP
jgi:predicted kinase